MITWHLTWPLSHRIFSQKGSWSLSTQVWGITDEAHESPQDMFSIFLFCLYAVTVGLLLACLPFSPLLPCEASPLPSPLVWPFFFFFDCAAGMQDPSSLTRDETHAPCSGSAGSEPLDYLVWLFGSSQGITSSPSSSCSEFAFTFSVLPLPASFFRFSWKPTLMVRLK